MMRIDLLAVLIETIPVSTCGSAAKEFGVFAQGGSGFLDQEIEFDWTGEAALRNAGESTLGGTAEIRMAASADDDVLGGADEMIVWTGASARALVDVGESG